MRLQLVAWFLCYTACCFSQSPAGTDLKTNLKVLDRAEVDFLFSFYHQEGNNSAVTGGTGTEKLSDVAAVIIVNVPIKPKRDLNVDYGVSYYTSASSDNINPNTISSASSDNLVFHLNVTSIYKDTASHSQTGIKAGVTHQNNFGSISLGAYYNKQSANKNRELKIQSSISADK